MIQETDSGAGDAAQPIRLISRDVDEEAWERSWARGIRAGEFL